MAKQKRKLTNDPEELLATKHAEDAHKQQFTNFAHNVTGSGATPTSVKSRARSTANRIRKTI